MPLKILVDENLPRTLVAFLRTCGIEALDVREIGLREATDREILEWASRNKFTVLTEDLGFGAFVPEWKIDHYGIVIIRKCERLSLEGLFQLIKECLAQISELDLKAKVVICEPGKIRISGKVSVPATTRKEPG